MKKIKEIISDIQAVILIVTEDLVSVAFMPLWYVLDMIERSVALCKTPIDDGDEPQPEEAHHIKGFGK